MDIGDLTSIQIYEDNVQGLKGETNLENMDDLRYMFGQGYGAMN